MYSERIEIVTIRNYTVGELKEALNLPKASTLMFHTPNSSGELTGKFTVSDSFPVLEVRMTRAAQKGDTV